MFGGGSVWLSVQARIGSMAQFERESATMELAEAIAAHDRWLGEMRVAIACGEEIDVARLKRDDCCRLGKWLGGAGREQYGKTSEFEACIARHKAFHVEAARVAGEINDGRLDDAPLLIGVQSELSRRSQLLRQSLISLDRRT